MGPSRVTRFKELRRIERAIENLDRVDLEWAAQYCQLRLTLVRREQHGAMWRRIEKRVREALQQIESK